MNTPLRPGDVLLGKYRIEHILGQGGMGVVVAARHLELTELFAIKFLLPTALESQQAVERFVREARAAARLKGPHVVKVHDVGRLESGAPYMIMEHLEGTDLKTLMRRRGSLPLEEAVTYLLHACEAIAEAHKFGIVHRDLKPANLFVTSTPDGAPWIKVLDFGISKQMVTTESHDLTSTGVVLGSPMYMSPEQLARTKDVDPRTDLWSLGVVLYELVTGTRPFQSKVLTEVVAQVLQNEPAPPSRLQPTLPAALDSIVLRCLEKRPEDRFQAIGELVAALRLLQSGTAPVAVAPPSATAAQVAASVDPAEAAPAPVQAPPVDSLPLEAASPAPAIAAVRPPLGSSPGASTAAAWGGTGATTFLRMRSRAGLTAAVVAAIALLGAGGAWLALREGSIEGLRGAASSAPDAPGAMPAEPPAVGSALAVGTDPLASAPAPAPAPAPAASQIAEAQPAVDPIAPDKFIVQPPSAPVPRKPAALAPPNTTVAQKGTQPPKAQKHEKLF